MRPPTLSFAVIVAATFAIMTDASAGAGGSDRLQLAIQASANASSSELVVDGAAGRYDRLTATRLTLPLTLNADFAGDVTGFKILKSEVFLKADGSGPDALRVDTLANAQPVRAISGEQTLTLVAAANGPVAQSAIAACNGVAVSDRPAGAHKVTLALAVLWRVTTGRSNFKWTNYDRVAPSDDILNNRDFYADQETADAETTVTATVVCQPMASAVVAANAPAKAVKTVALTSTPIEPRISAQPVSTASVTTAALKDTAKPQCDGGMVRQVSNADADFVCLCPGNTERVAKGENAFACEKRSRR